MGKRGSHLPQAKPGSCTMHTLKKWDANLIQVEKLKESLEVLL